MLLFTHIIIAVFSIVVAGYTALFPTNLRLRFTYLSIFGTTLSGLVLVLVNPSSLGRSCISGIVYFGFILFFLKAIKKRFAFRLKELNPQN